MAEKKLAAAKTIEVTEATPNKAAIGKIFKKDAKSICDQLAALSLDDIEALKVKHAAEEKYQLGDFALGSDLVTVNTITKTVHVEEIIPNVIEPSFGIGRIMYALLEHSFNMRDGDEQRSYLSLPPLVAPIKCSVLPLSNNADLAPFIQQISWALTHNEVSHKVDSSSGSIGRRYARTDEIAIPYGITIDFDTLKEPHTVTLRERDSMQQLRIPLAEIADVVRILSAGKTTWESVASKFPKFEQQEAK